LNIAADGNERDGLECDLPHRSVFFRPQGRKKCANMAPQSPKPPSWWRLHDRLRQLARERDDDIGNLHLGPNPDPARVRVHLPPLPELLPPRWVPCVEKDGEFIVRFYFPDAVEWPGFVRKGPPTTEQPGKRRSRKVRPSKAERSRRKWLKKELPALLPDLPAGADDRLIRDVHYAGVLYVQEQLVERYPRQGTLSWRELRDLRHTILREAIERDTGGIARAAPHDFRGFYHVDRCAFIRQSLRALMARSRELHERGDGGGEPRLPLTVATMPMPENGEPEIPVTPEVRSMLPMSTDRSTPEPIPPVKVASKPATKPAGRKRGRPRDEETTWSRYLEKCRAELSKTLEPGKPATLAEIAVILGLKNARALDRLGELDPKDEKRCRAKAHLQRPVAELVGEIQDLRPHPKPV
jgi:hypothetical protein